MQYDTWRSTTHKDINLSQIQVSGCHKYLSSSSPNASSLHSIHIWSHLIEVRTWFGLSSRKPLPDKLHLAEVFLLPTKLMGLSPLCRSLLASNKTYGPVPHLNYLMIQIVRSTFSSQDEQNKEHNFKLHSHQLVSVVWAHFNWIVNLQSFQVYFLHAFP